MQLSYATTVDKLGSTRSFQIHPELAEWKERIFRRDLKLQRKSGFKTFIRALYIDLHEEQCLRWAGHEMDKELPEYIAGVMVSRVASEVNVRLPMDQARFQENIAEGKYPLLSRQSKKGFGVQD